jgi:hypothetical protein
VSFAIERTDDGLPVYFTLRVGRDHASPLGGWTSEMKHALQFGREADVKAFARVYLKELAPWCEAVPYTEEANG